MPESSEDERSVPTSPLPPSSTEGEGRYESEGQTCPHVVTSDGGTSYCTLAETGIPHAVVADIRRLQAMLHDAVDGDLLCEDICQSVCAGPCVGRGFGPVTDQQDDGIDERRAVLVAQFDAMTAPERLVLFGGSDT